VVLNVLALIMTKAKAKAIKIMVAAKATVVKVKVTKDMAITTKTNNSYTKGVGS
jgi:hypothetical protein